MAPSRAATAGPVAAGSRSDPVSEELAQLFLRVGMRMKHHVADVAATMELSPPQAWALQELGEPRSMGELAERLACDASNITGIVDRLEARGLVERQPVAGDRRVKRLVLTPAGEELRRTYYDRVFRQTPLLTGLSARERRELRDLMLRMLSSSGSGG